jgi:hypothetical protein
MTCLRIIPRSQRRAGRFPGDPTGLSRTPRDPASGRPPEALLRGSPTAVARASPHAILTTRTWSRCDRAARPASPPSPSINPHTAVPAPRFCPNDL